MIAASVAPETADTADWLSQLASGPLPSRRQEDWRFTDLSALSRLKPALLTCADPVAGLPLPSGLSRLDSPQAEPWLGHALAATGSLDHWPVRLNCGARPPLLALRVRGAVDPLELRLDAGPAPGLAAFRLLLVLEADASLELLLRPATSGANALSLVTEVVLEAGARLTLGSLALGHRDSCFFNHTAVLQSPGSALNLTTVTGCWALSRQEPRILQHGGGATTRLRGLQVCRNRELTDTHSFVRFDGPNGRLDQVHKAVADGEARSVFNGAVQVPRLAQHTNASQLSRNLLLSDRARIDTKPELEIVADDVKCTHGATVSRLQIDELFYLQSRGIAAAQAAQLLQRAFCEDVVRELPPAALADQPLIRLLGEA